MEQAPSLQIPNSHVVNPRHARDRRGDQCQRQSTQPYPRVLALLDNLKCDSILHDPLLEVLITISVRIGERDRWVDSEWTGSLETLHGHMQASSGVYPAARLLRLDVSWYQQGEIEERYISTGNDLKGDRTVGSSSQSCGLQGRGKTMVGCVIACKWPINCLPGLSIFEDCQPTGHTRRLCQW